MIPRSIVLWNRFGQDVRAATLTYRALALWLLGYPKAALADADHALKTAREIREAATLMFVLFHVNLSHFFRGDYAVANTIANEVFTLADEKGALFWRAIGMLHQGCSLVLNGEACDAVQLITSGLNAFRSTRATAFLPLYLSYLARAYTELGSVVDARRSIGEAMAAIETTSETWCEAEVHRIAGEIVLKSPKPDPKKAQAYFERALAVARQQRAKSWELRAAMSMARLWREQGKPDDARGLLAPIYGWFTEGFDTLDLKEAGALLDELAS
jgi:predicted ATPase